MTLPIDGRAVEAALETIREEPRILKTPTIYSGGLSSYLSGEYGFPVHVYLKLESLQTTRSYKIRGAYNKISRLVERVGANGIDSLVAASAGNHAQGVGFAARAFELADRTVIHMPRGAPWAKKKGTRQFGVMVDDSHASFEDARKAVQEASGSGNGVYAIPPYDDPDIMAGQGTVAMEVMEALGQHPLLACSPPSRTTVVCPIGGGGLVAGVATWLHAAVPAVRVVGVEPVGTAKSRRSVASGENHARASVKTMADGVRVLRLGDLTYPIIRALLPEACICNVSEARILRAIRRLSVEGLIAEGAGALCLAALMDVVDRRGGPPHRASSREESPPLELQPDEWVVLVVSGANVTAGLVRRQLAIRATEEAKEELGGSATGA